MTNPYAHHPSGGDGRSAARATDGHDPGTSTDSLAREAGERTHERVESAREAAADSIETLAAGVRDAASELRDDRTVGPLSEHFSRLAEGMTRAASSLREKSGDDLMHDLSRLARENPTVFVGGAMALGFGLTRFARASSTRPHGSQTPTQDRGARAARGEHHGAGVSAGFPASGGDGYGSASYGSASGTTTTGTTTRPTGYTTGSPGVPVAGTGYGTGGSTVSGTGTDYGTGASTVSGTDSSTPGASPLTGASAGTSRATGGDTGMTGSQGRDGRGGIA